MLEKRKKKKIRDVEQPYLCTRGKHEAAKAIENKAEGTRNIY